MNEGRQGEQNETGAGTRNLNDVLAYTWPSLLASPALNAYLPVGIAINTVWHFDAFKWAARGKVRPSVRWKSNRSKRAQQIARSFLWDRRSGFRLGSGDKTWEEPMSKAVQYPYIAYWAHHSACLLKAFSKRFRARLRRYVVSQRKKTNHMKWLGVSEDPELQYLFSQRGLIEGSIINLMSLDLVKGRMPDASKIMAWVSHRGDKCSAIQLLSTLKKVFASDGILSSTFRKLHTYLRSMTRLRITLAVALKHLEEEAYRAHLTRRVKPVSRRIRILRPIHARPQPPSAPLAPPV